MPWDFWIALEKKDGIACGRLIPSRDCLNRPYPLLMMGQGPIYGWVGFWERLPLAMESTWNGMVGLANLQGHSLDALINHLSILPAPDGCWSMDRDGIFNCCNAKSETGYFFHEDGMVRLEINGGPKWDGVVEDMAGLLKNNGRTQTPPRAVFIHRGPGSTSIRLFYRPVTPSDVVDMWRFNGRDRNHESD
jgi:hypothetical protein